MLTLTNVALRISGRILFENTSLTIHQGKRVGLVGANGSGKTSLFRMVQGELEPDVGTLDLASGTRIACMAQELPASDEAALAFVESGDTDVAAINEQIAQADTSGDFEKLGTLHDKLHALDGYRTRTRAQKMLVGLGFTETDFDKPLRDFSGGWRVRLNLANTLMRASDLLLLDEPTNHLDLDAMLWLAEWIRHYQGAMILISHDREFLDETVEQIALLEHNRIELFQGNYSAFEAVRAARLAEQQGMFEKQQREIAHMQDFVRRFRYKATKARQAQSRIKALEKMERIAPAHIDSPFNFSFRESTRLSDPLISLEKADLGYTHPVLSTINFSLRPGDRYGLLGHNGAGKSTLIKSLQGELPLVGGERTDGANLNVGYFSQHQIDDLDLCLSPLQSLLALEPGIREQDARNFLGGFNFRGTMVEEPITTFSGGEKARLALALVAFSAPNLLLMDEPTNHLDMDMRQALAVALQNFSGALLLISHDRHLLASTVDEFLLVGDGTVGRFDGDLDDYRRQLLGITPLKESEPPDAEPTQDGEADKGLSSPGNKSSRGETRRVDHKRARQIKTRLGTLEGRMERLARKLAEVETGLSDPDIYNAEDSNLHSLIRDQTELKEQIEGLEMDWLELSTELENLG